MKRTERLNVLFIVMDSGRRDRFGCYGYPRGTTPTVDSLAREGMVFDHMSAAAPWTLPSHGSLFTGLYPREHGADYPGKRMRSGVLTLDRHLQDHGYRTVFITSNRLVGKQTGIVDEGSDLLFRHQVDAASKRQWVRSLRTLAGVSDRGAGATTRAVSRLIGELAEPFFVFINYMECHWRYMAPRAYERRFVRRRFTPLDAALYRKRFRRRRSWENGRLEDPEEQMLLSDLYDSAVAWVDNRISDLLETLDRSGRRDDTVVVVTADHGENLGDHGLSGHGMWLYESLLHVPFVVRVPGGSPMRASGLVQLTDVFAGLCRLLGIDIPGYLQERKIAADPDWLVSGRPNRDFVFAEWHQPETSEWMARKQYEAPPDMQSVCNGRYKLIVQPETGAEWLFDLHTDPGETDNRLADLRAEKANLQTALDDWKDTTQPLGAVRAYSPEEEAALEARLRELGYL